MALLVPLPIAVVDSRLAAWASIATFAIVAVFRLSRFVPTKLDLTALILLVLVVVSPAWSYLPEFSIPASRGVAASLSMFLAVRVGIQTHSEVRALLGGVSVITLVSSYYLASTGAESVDIYQGEELGTRVAFDFANANYTAAILAFGGAVSLFLVVSKGSSFLRAVAFLGYLTSGVGTLLSGSRASSLGLVLASLALLVARRRSRRVLIAGAVSLGLSLFMVMPAFLVQQYGRAISALGGGFSRGSGEALLDGSGRLAIWDSTWETIQSRPLLGWGLEGYRFVGEVPVLAHSWYLELLASLGIVGLVLVSCIVMMSAMSWGQGLAPAKRSRPDGQLLVGATALAIAPTMALSTHQWTLWAWFAVALWSKAWLLEPRAEADLVDSVRR